MIGTVWCGVRASDRIEMHMFPLDSQKSVCSQRIRGKDRMEFVMKGAPSAPDGYVCPRCWELHVQEVLR